MGITRQAGTDHPEASQMGVLGIIPSGLDLPSSTCVLEALLPKEPLHSDVDNSI